MLRKDIFEDLVEPKILNVSETSDLYCRARKSKDNDAKRLDVRMHITTENYTGFIKKGFNVDLENLEELIFLLQKLNSELQAKDC